MSKVIGVAAFSEEGKVVTRLVQEDGSPGEPVVFDPAAERWCLIAGRDWAGKPTPGDVVDVPEFEPAVITAEQAQRGAIRRVAGIATEHGNEAAAVYLAGNGLLNDDMRMAALEVIADTRRDASRLLKAGRAAVGG